MRDLMKIWDRVFFYHSNCPVPGIAGIAEVSSLPHPDETQFIVWDKHFDPKSTRDKPIWQCVNVRFIRKLDRIISLWELRNTPWLETLRILQKGNRLSITPVTKEEYENILGLTS